MYALLTTVALALVAATSASPDTLHLAAALRIARENRGSLAAAAALVREARADRQVAGTIPNPSIRLSFDESAPRRQVMADQPLSWLARRSAERGRAAAGLDRALADSTLRDADLSREVKQAFHGALASEGRLVALIDQARIADSVVALGRRRAEAGDISSLELEQIIQEAARAKQSVNEGNERRAAAMFQLARALGVADTNGLTPAGDLAEGLDAPLPDLPSSMRALPGIRIAAADSAAAARHLSSVARDRLPIPSALLGVEWDEPDAVIRRSYLIIGVSLPLPVWNIGTGRSRVARAAADRAAADLREATLETERIVREHRARIEARSHRARLAQNTIRPSAERVRTGTLRQYAVGRATVLAVFESLRAERDITLALIDDLVAFQNARADLNAILGRSN